jgi:hypothetical protein
MTAVSIATAPLLVTYDNAPNDNTRYFIKTLETQGWSYKLIGVGEKWGSWPTRMRAYRDFLCTLDDEQLVVLSDARDVVCVRGPKAFVKGFNTFKKDMVVSMELLCGGKLNPPEIFNCVQCIPLTAYWRHHKVDPLPCRKFVNNGLVSGRAKALKACLNWIIDNNYVDDQLGLGAYMNAFPDRVAADVNADILHTTNFGVNAGIQSIHVQKHDSPTFAELFGRGAFFIHISGLGGKGQLVMYKFVCTMIDTGSCDNLLREPYKYSEPEWDEVF